MVFRIKRPFTLYLFIFPLFIACIDDRKDYNVAQCGKRPGDGKAQDQTRKGGVPHINGCHPYGAEAEDPYE